MSDSRHIWAIIPAGGSGERFGSNKLMAPLCGETVLAHTLTAIATHSAIAGVVIAAPKGDLPDYQASFGQTYANTSLVWVSGGATRRDSVYAALQATPANCKTVLIHDAARPLLTHDLIDEVVAPVVQSHAVGAIVGLPVTDTVKQVEAVTALNVGKITATVPRDTLWTVQTPQVFTRTVLMAAHQQVSHELPVTDDAQLVELARLGDVLVVPGHARNLKITTPQDLALAEWWLNQP